MDTFKDKMLLDDLYARDKAPWAVWKERAGLLPDTEHGGASGRLKKAGGF
jgi:hypothetical protein